MGILNYRYDNTEHYEQLQADDRLNRIPLDDLKQGIDLIFELKEKIDKLHPIATETLIRLLSY
jgi:hypothetical protein